MRFKSVTGDQFAVNFISKVNAGDRRRFLNMLKMENKIQCKMPICTIVIKLGSPSDLTPNNSCFYCLIIFFSRSLPIGHYKMTWENVAGRGAFRLRLKCTINLFPHKGHLLHHGSISVLLAKLPSAGHNCEFVVEWILNGVERGRKKGNLINKLLLTSNCAFSLFKLTEWTKRLFLFSFFFF